MRCPSCGTENAQDSRFCGGCGLRFGPVEHRVAPTAKMSDDAVYPQVSSPPQKVRAAVQPQLATMPTPLPGSLPHPAYGSQPPRATTDPGAQRSPAESHTRTTPRAQASIRPPGDLRAASPSLALPARRPVGLMIVMIVIDLALAAAGALMLAKGLGTGSGASSGASGPVAPPPAPASAPSPHAALAPAAPPPSASPAGAAAASAGPVDPYASPSVPEGKRRPRP